MFVRSLKSVLQQRLFEKKVLIQVLIGPRQVGKTTILFQIQQEMAENFYYFNADDSIEKNSIWIKSCWQQVINANKLGKRIIIAFDEIQKVENWSEVIKSLWDNSIKEQLNIALIVSGSSQLLLNKGLTESLAGRFEVLTATHWSYFEAKKAFNLELDDYLYFGCYPGAFEISKDTNRWKKYIIDSIIETVITKDILLYERIEKPALLRRLFYLAAMYTGQIISYNKLVGQLQDVGNTTTVAHYLDLLSMAGLITSLSKYSGSEVRTRNSSPKILVMNNSLYTAITSNLKHEMKNDPEVIGRIVETSVGMHLLNLINGTNYKLYYWSEGNKELDFVLVNDKNLYAIEVKSGRKSRSILGLKSFCQKYPSAKAIIIGEDGLNLQEFLHSTTLF